MVTSLRSEADGPSPHGSIYLWEADEPSSHGHFLIK
jgi:hypothetical protein